MHVSQLLVNLLAADDRRALQRGDFVDFEAVLRGGGLRTVEGLRTVQSVSDCAYVSAH